MGTLSQGAGEASNLSGLSLHAELLMPPQGFATGGGLGTVMAAPVASSNASGYLTPSRHDAVMTAGLALPSSTSPAMAPPGDARAVETAHDVEELVNGKVWDRH